MSTSFHRRGILRTLLTGGVVVAVALLPGTAGAADDPLPSSPPAVPEVVEEVLEGEQSPATATADEESPAPGAAAAEGDEPPSGPDPIGELRAQIEEIRSQFPENECVDGLAAALEGLITTIADPADFEDYQADLAEYLAGLPDVLEGLEPGGTPPSPPPLPAGPSAAEVEAALAALAAALQACIPAEPGEEPTDPPAEQPEQPVQPAAPSPAAQPVSYPGYAPTGAASPDNGDALVPLAAVAGALLLGGGSLVVARSRRRSG